MPGRILSQLLHGLGHAGLGIFTGKGQKKRTVIVIDPRFTDTANVADIHLQVKPGTDAWCLAALAAILVQDDLVAHPWLADHTTGFAEITIGEFHWKR